MKQARDKRRGSRLRSDGKTSSEQTRRLNSLAGPVVASATLAQLLTWSDSENVRSGYELVVWFPSFFGIAYLATWSHIGFRQSSAPLLLGIYTIIQWIRFTIMPVAIVLAGDSAGLAFVAPAPQTIELATLLILAEMVVSGITIHFLCGRPRFADAPAPTRMLGDKLVYLVYLAVAVLAYLVVGRNRDLLNFVFLPAGSGERAGDLTETSLVIVRQVLLVALFVSLMWAVAAGSDKYQKDGNRSHFYLPLLLGLVNVCVIVGERRSAQVLTAFCVTLTLVRGFPHLKKQIHLLVWGTAGAVLALMTIYKTLMVFQYGSYEQAVSASSYGTAEFSRTLQAYFAGPQLLAAGIEYSQMAGVQTWGMVYDLLRSTVPLSFLFKDSGQLTSISFNRQLYKGQQDTGQVISAAAYGVMYLGPAFFWVFSVTNLLFAYVLERLVWSSRSYEALFIYSYIFMRVALNLTANTPALVSGVTIMLMTGGLLVGIATLVSRRHWKGIEWDKRSF